MDPMTVNTLAKVYQQELIERGANGGWGNAANKDVQAMLDETKDRRIWQKPPARFQFLAWPRRLLAGLVASAAKSFNPRQPSDAAVCAVDPCAFEGE